tara:strand:- start:322 stop:1113 length:792 start_codon:yes stop_codon:yes gene_type:complete
MTKEKLILNKLWEESDSQFLSMGKLAEKVGVSKTSIWNWRTGEKAPSIEHFLALGEALGFDVKISLRKKQAEKMQQMPFCFFPEKAKVKQRGGRPSKFTKQTREFILQELFLGASKTEACKNAGISYELFRRWMRKGENCKSGIYYEFLNKVNQKILEGHHYKIHLEHVPNRELEQSITESTGVLVYFIESLESKKIKIGTSKNPKARLKQLQTSNPSQLKILKVIPGGFAKEFQIHRKFSQSRVCGEWFKDSEELRKYIEEA